MRYFLIGLITGAILAAMPLLMHTGAPALYPQWRALSASPESTQATPDTHVAGEKTFSVAYNQSILAFKPDGLLSSRHDIPADTLFSMSNDGAFYSTYRKVGNLVEFLGISGERFWSKQSQEYPYLSPHGKIAILMVADLSKIRLFDYNGNELGVKSISGVLCTAVSFAAQTDAAVIGFLDGNFYMISDKGAIVYQGKVPAGNIVKSAALSDNGTFIAVHYGSTEKDGIMVVDVAAQKAPAFNLPSRHLSKTAIYIADNGDVAICNMTMLILCDKNGNVISSINIPKQKPGQASITHTRGIYAFTFRKEEGGTAIYFLTDAGSLLFKRDLPNEPFLDCSAEGKMFYAHGTETAYAWRID
jgi:hypothetical protein